MEFIRTIRFKQQTAREESLAKEAEKVITLSDFANTPHLGEEFLNVYSRIRTERLEAKHNNYNNARSESLKKNILNNANRSKSKGNKNY